MRRESLFFGILTLVVSALPHGMFRRRHGSVRPPACGEFNPLRRVGPATGCSSSIRGRARSPSRCHNDRIRDFEFSGKYFDWEMRQGAESRFLVLNLKKEVERKPFLEKIALRGIASKSGEAATDTLFLVSQPKLESSALG